MRELNMNELNQVAGGDGDWGPDPIYLEQLRRDFELKWEWFLRFIEQD